MMFKGPKTSVLQDLSFSLTLADPTIDGCPLVGCSTGFGTLCGYEMSDIIGRNCRFLVDPVPAHLVNNKVRAIVRGYCQAIAKGETFSLPEEEKEPWMPQKVRNDGLFVAQTNARKDGSLFDNMFYLRNFELDGQPYIAGLQTELPRGVVMQARECKDDVVLQKCHEACKLLDMNWVEVERVLAASFWYSGPMRRQDDFNLDDGFVPDDSDALLPLAPDTAEQIQDPVAEVITEVDERSWGACCWSRA